MINIGFLFKKKTITNSANKLVVEPVLSGKIDLEIDEEKLIQEERDRLLKAEIRKAVKELLPEPEEYEDYQYLRISSEWRGYDRCIEQLVNIIYEESKNDQ